MLSPGSDFKEKWDVQGGENQMHWELGVYRSTCKAEDGSRQRRMCV